MEASSMVLKRYQNRNWLYTQYVTNRKNIEEIAKIEQVTPKTIDRYLDKFNLKRSRRTWNRG